MKRNRTRLTNTALLSAAVAALAAGPAVLADWQVNDGGSSRAGKPQDIVISLKLDPATNVEAACLSVTLARSLRGDFSGAGPTAPNVTLFPTLDGVAIGSADVLQGIDGAVPDEDGNGDADTCLTPLGFISLEQNLVDFLAGNDNNMVVCPLCWSTRFDGGPDYGVLFSPAVNEVLLNADKVIDF